MKWKKEWWKLPEWEMSDLCLSVLHPKSQVRDSGWGLNEKQPPPKKNDLPAVWECDLCGNMFYSVRESIAHEAVQWYIFWQEAQATYYTLLWPSTHNRINARVEIEKTRDKAEETFKGLVEQIERGGK